MNYLVSTSLEELGKLYKKEKDANVKQRLLICIHRKEEKIYRGIGKILKIPKTVVHRWVLRRNKK